MWVVVRICNGKPEWMATVGTEHDAIEVAKTLVVGETKPDATYHTIYVPGVHHV